MSHIEQIPSRLRITLGISLLIIAVSLPFTVRAGFFDGLFTEEIIVEVVDETTLGASPTEISLLSAGVNPDPQGGRGGAEVVVDDNALVSTGPVGEDEIAEASLQNSGEIRVYTVREGDSLSEVAEMFGVTANTIKWANDISSSTGIQPGDTLVILPIAGVRHVVKSGDTISTIAKKYEGNEEEILSYNQLADESDLTVGATVIVPGGAMHAATPARSRAAASSAVAAGGSSAGFTHPAPGAVRTQGIHGYNAVDLAGGHGSAIRAAAAGEVIVAKASGWNGGYGTYVVIRHSNGTQTLYAHLSSLNVGVGSYVGQGQVIGGMGNSGRSTGTHLHFEVRGGRNPF